MQSIENVTGKVQSVGIIGGGSAGYIAALYLKATFPHLKISLVESSRIPVIGVGEATTPQFRDFIHRKLGISHQEFYSRTKPTIKLGVKFYWGKPGPKAFHSPFGKTDLWNAVYHTQDSNNMSFLSLLMGEDRVPFVPRGEQLAPLNLEHGYAYHVDNQKFLKYMREILIERGCEYIDAEVAEAMKTADGSALASVVTTDHRKLTYDLFIDCTGFRSTLLEKTMGAGWVSFEKSLFTNRAIIGTKPSEDEIKPYTVMKTMKHGWLWNTPLQHEEHLGYVFSGNHCTDDEAVQEFEQQVSKVVNGRVITFRPGRHTESWRGNVVGIGNSFAFVEPLQATGLHMVLRQMRAVATALREGSEPRSVARYNEFVNVSWDKIKEFIALYFRHNKNMDTAFWRDCARDIEIGQLQEYVTYFEEHGPITQNPDHPFKHLLADDPIYNAYTYDIAMVKFGKNEERLLQRSPGVTDEWIARYKLNSLLKTQCTTHRAALKYMEEVGTEFVPAQEIVI